MGRHFTGGTSDYIDLGPGNAAPIDGGPATIMILWRPTSVHEGWLIDAEDGSGGHAFSINPYTDGILWHTMVGIRTTMTYTASDGWRLDLWTKPAGSAQVRGHTMLLSGGGWSHADYGLSTDSPNVPSTHFRVGRHFSAGGTLNGDLAAIAVVDADWSDGAIEAGSLETGLAAWMTLISADAAVVWAFNQTDVSDPVTDVTGGGGDQLAISGTTVTDDPPGFSYLLTEPTDCQFSATMPALEAAISETSTSTAMLSAGLPAVSAHLTIGASIPPPSMTGTATVRSLLGSAAVV